MLEDERLVAPLHKSRGQQIRFDYEGHIILLRGVNGELCDVDQIVQVSSVGLASVACGNTAVVDGFNRIAVSSMMHEGAEHSDGLNQIVLSSTMYGAVKGSLPLARRAKEQGINDTLPIAVRMLSVLKRHAQRRCIDQGSRAIGWELLLLPGRIYRRCLSRRSCFLQDMSMGGALTTCHTLPAGRCCPSQKMATGCCHLSDEVLTGGVLIRCHTPPFGRYCCARSMFMGSTLIREPWLFSRRACGKVIDQVLYIASGRSVDHVPHGVVKRSLPLVRLTEERSIDDTLSIAVRMLLLSNRHARGRYIDRVLRASSWELLLLSGRVDRRYFSRRHCFLQGMSTSGASINCHTLPARRCCYSQETAAGRYHLLQAMHVEGISIWCHTLPLGRYSYAQGMFKSSALIRKLRLFSRNACGKGVDQVLSIASGRHGGHVSRGAAKRLLPLARRAEERGIDEALSTAVRILVSKRHTRGRCIDQVLQAFGWELLLLTGRVYGRCFSRRSCLLQDMSKGGASITCHTLPAGLCCPSQSTATGGCYLLQDISTGGVVIRSHTPLLSIRARWLFSRHALISVLLIDRRLLPATGHGVALYRDETGLTHDYVLSLIFTAQYMSREPAAEVGLDLCDHPVLPTVKYDGSMYRDGTDWTADYVLSLRSTALCMGRKLATEVGFDIFDRIVLSSSGHGGSVYRDGTSLTADYILSPMFTVQCRGRELAAEAGFDIFDRIVLSSSGHGGSVYRDGNGLACDYVLSLISTVQYRGRELAAEVGFDIFDRIVISSSGHGGAGYRDGNGLASDYVLSLICTARCRGRELAAEGWPPTTQSHVSNIKYIDCVVGSYIVLPSSEGSRVGSADCKVLFQAVTIHFGALMPVFGIDCIDGAVYTEYMSREPAAKVGFDSCDHTVLLTARHHDHAVFLFFMAQYVGRELVFAFNIDYIDCAGTVDCKVLFQAATAQCVALRLAFDIDCIDYGVHGPAVLLSTRHADAGTAECKVLFQAATAQFVALMPASDIDCIDDIVCDQAVLPSTGRGNVGAAGCKVLFQAATEQCVALVPVFDIDCIDCSVHDHAVFPSTRCADVGTADCKVLFQAATAQWVVLMLAWEIDCIDGVVHGHPALPSTRRADVDTADCKVLFQADTVQLVALMLAVDIDCIDDIVRDHAVLPSMRRGNVGTADCKVLFQAATDQCVALGLAFDIVCIDCVFHGHREPAAEVGFDILDRIMFSSSGHGGSGYRDGTKYNLSLICTVQCRGRELAAGVGFDIFSRIVLSSSEHSGSVDSDGTSLTADHVLSLICTAQCMGRELAAEVGFDICGHILLSASKYGGSVYRDGTGMTADHVWSLTPATQGIVLLVSMDQPMSQEFATGTGLATCDWVVFFSPLVVLVRLPTLVMKDVNRARVNCSMIAQGGRGLDDRLGRRHRYRLKLMGHVTTEDIAEASTTSDVEPGEGKPGLRFLEFKLLSGKTIILMVDNQARVQDVLHKLPGVEWLSVNGRQVSTDSLVSNIPGNSTLMVRARLRGGGRIFMADEAVPMQCEERSTFGFACDSTCSNADCINKIPEAIWSEDEQALCFPNSKVQVVRGDPLDKSNKGLLVTHSIKNGEIVAVFGNTTAIGADSPAGGAFNRIRDDLLRKSTPKRQLQYSVLGRVENDDIKSGRVWIIPRADADLAWAQLRNMPRKGPGERSLTELLHKQGPPGKGHLANHVCCKWHSNLNIEVVQIKYSATSEEPAALVPVAILRAGRDVAAGELGCTSYQANINTWNRIFQCECCQCQGPCAQASGPSVVMPSPEAWKGYDLFLSTAPLRTGAEDDHQPYRLNIPKTWGDVDVEPSSLRRLAVHRPLTAREVQAAYLDDELMNLLAKWGADGRPFKLSTQRQARVMSTFLWKRLDNGTYDLSGSTDDYSSRIPIPLLEHVFIPIHHPLHWCLCHINITSKSMTYLDPSGVEMPGREASVRMKTWEWMRSRYSAQNWERFGVDSPRWELRLCDTHKELLSLLPNITKDMAHVLHTRRDARTMAQLIREGTIMQETVDQWQRCGIFLLGTEDESGGGWDWSARASGSTPRQGNAFDCGMFVLLYIIYCARGWRMNFAQEHMEHCRSWFLRTVLSIGSWQDGFTCQVCSRAVFGEDSQSRTCVSCHRNSRSGRSARSTRQLRGIIDCSTSSNVSHLSSGITDPTVSGEAKSSSQGEVRGGQDVLLTVQPCDDDSCMEVPSPLTAEQQSARHNVMETSDDETAASGYSDDHSLPKPHSRALAQQRSMMVTSETHSGGIIDSEQCAADDGLTSDATGGNPPSSDDRVEVLGEPLKTPIGADISDVVCEATPKAKRKRRQISLDAYGFNKTHASNALERQESNGTTQHLQQGADAVPGKDDGLDVSTASRRPAAAPMWRQIIPTVSQARELQQRGGDAALRSLGHSNNTPGRECAMCKARHAHQRCKRCRNAYYCNQGCLEQHWSDHRNVCHPGDWCAGCGGASGAVACGAVCKMTYCSHACKIADAGRHKHACKGKLDKSKQHDKKAEQAANAPNDGVRVRQGGHRLVSDGDIITKLDDRTTHDSRTHVTDKDSAYKACDLEEESRLRDEVIDALHRQRSRIEAMTDQDDSVETGRTAWKALRVQRLQQALERAGQFVGGKENIDVASELGSAEKWIEQHLRPWILSMRCKRYQHRLMEEAREGRVLMRFNGLPVDTLTAAKQWITRQGIRVEEKAWSYASFQIRRLRSGGRAATELVVEVRASPALMQLFTGKASNGHSGVWCEFVDRNECGDDASGRTALLRPVGAGATWLLRCFTELWQSVGVDEGELREIMLAAIQTQLLHWRAVDLHTWSPDQPRSLRATWDGTGRQRGQIRVNGAPFSISEINANNRLKAWGVAGRTKFEKGANRATGWYPDGVHRDSPSAFVQLGLPTSEIGAEDVPTGDQLDDVVRQAPAWLRDFKIPVRWEPLAVGEGVENQSAVCIRILQVHHWKGTRGWYTRREVRNRIAGILNHIQQLCWPENEAYTAADVDFIGFTNEHGLMEGMISISKRSETLFENDCLVGAILAFFIGHRVREKRVQAFQWCPARCELGKSSCGITGITVANDFKGRSRRQVVFGTQRPGRATWVVNSGRDGTVRRIAAVLCKTGSKEALLTRLKYRKWDRARSLLEAGQGEGIDAAESTEGEVQESTHDKQKPRRTTNRIGVKTHSSQCSLNSIHPLVCVRDHQGALWQIPGLKRRLLEAKRRWLYLQGEWAGAKSVTGDWMLKGGTQGPWRRSGWEAVGEVVKAQQALAKCTMGRFLQQMHESGHVGLSGIGSAILLDEDEDVTMDATTCRLRAHDWMFWLEQEARWERPALEGNVVSWNVGPLGHALSKQSIQETLRQGLAIVMLQEVSFPPGAERRVRKELRQAGPDYICLMEMGRHRGWEEAPGEITTGRSGWHSGKQYAVVTFLHRAFFKTASKKEWNTADTRKGLRHMTEGRVLWAEAQTHAGKLVHIVNIHQATSTHLELQQTVLHTLKGKLSRQPHATIMAGDFNADPTGRRAGYAQSNAAHIQEVDEVFQRFVKETRGTLVSPSTGSWQDIHTGKTATLDHLLLWNMGDQEVVAGRADWIGHHKHDHARVKFSVARELLQKVECCEESKVYEPKHKLDEWVAAAPALESNMHEWVADATGKVQRDEHDAGDVCSQLLQKRDDFMKGLKKSDAPERRRHEGRMPHRSKAQILAMRELACAETALREGVKGERGTLAQELCLAETQIGGETGLTRDERIFILGSMEWQRFLQARVAMRENALHTIMQRQVDESRRAMDRQARREFLEEHKGPSKFTGKRSAGMTPEQLHWDAIIGAQWILREDQADTELWDRRREALTRACPSAQVQIEEEQWCIGAVSIKYQLAAQAESWIDRAIQSWRRRQAQLRMPEYVRLLGQEWSKQEGQQGGQDRSRQLQMRIAESMWQLETAQGGQGDIGYEGWRGEKGVIWRMRGEAASTKMHTWIDHLTQKDMCEQHWCTITEEAEGGNLVVRQEDTGVIWVLDKTSDVVRQLATEGTMGRYEAKQETGQQPSSEGCPLEAARWATAGIEASQKSTEAIRIITVTVDDLEEVGGALLEMQQWGAEGLVHKRLLRSTGPWRRENMTVAWELYFQEQGLAPHVQCEHEHCQAAKPRIVTRRRQIDVRECTTSKRKLMGFCCQCWQETSFRHGKDRVADMSFMRDAGVFLHKVNSESGQRLRGTLTRHEFRKFVSSCLRSGKSAGPDKHVNESIRTMSEEQLELIRIWANQILTETGPARSVTMQEMEGHISLLHKGGSTSDKASDWRPVVLLNCTNQLIMHVLNARLRDIVERANILEPGQAGGRRGRGTDLNLCKLVWIMQEAQKQKRTVVRVDVDFRNAFNAMSQAALWAVMEELNIPDVDLLKGLYANATVRLKPGGGQSKDDAEGSTVTFDTGVAQGSALSPLLFLIFMNTLLRLLTAKGRELGISHGLEGVDQFNNMAFADDLSLFAQSTGDMQVLLDEVQKFEAWSGLKVNRDKTCALIAGVKSDTTQQRTGLSYNGSAIRILGCGEACRYLGLWSTANGDMSEMKERVRKKTQEAIDLMKHHPLTPKMAIELFTSIGVGAFRYSAALVPWTWAELQDLGKMWIQGYKLAWKQPFSAASEFFILPTHCGGLGLSTPLAIMTQELYSHIQRCLQHEDVVLQITLRELEEAKKGKLCKSFEDLQDEMELWKWDDVRNNRWMRLSKCLQLLGLRIEGHDVDEDDEERVSWAEATRNIRRLRSKLNDMQWSKEKWSAEVWNDKGRDECAQMTQRQWEMLWQGEETFRRCSKELGGTGVEAHLAPQEPFDNYQKAPCLPPMLRDRQENTVGKQIFRVLLPLNLSGVKEEERRLLQEWLDLVDWRESRVRQRTARQRSGIWAYTKAQATGADKEEGSAGSSAHRRDEGERDTKRLRDRCETLRTIMRQEGHTGDQLNAIERALDDLGGSQDPAQMVLGAARTLWNESVEETFLQTLWLQCRRRLPETWQRIDEADEGHLEDGDRCRQLCLKLVTVFNRLVGRCSECQGRKHAWCKECKLSQCRRCAHETGECMVCGQAWDRQREDDGNAHLSSGNGKSTRKRRVPISSATNMHELGRTFVEEVLDVREVQTSTEEETTMGHHLQFKCQIRGWQQEARARLRAQMLGLTDVGLRQYLAHSKGCVLFHFASTMWPTISPRYGEDGWWYAAREEVTYLECGVCEKRILKGQFEQKACNDIDHQTCPACVARRTRDAKRQARASQKAAAPAGRADGRPVRNSKRHISYVEVGSSDEELEEGPQREAWTIGLIFTTADPRYVGKDREEAGSVLLSVEQVREILRGEEKLACQVGTVWLTTSQMGWPICAEEDEVVNNADIEGYGPTKRCIAPMISKFVRDKGIDGDETMVWNSALRQAWCLEQEWGEEREDVETITREAKRIKQIAGSLNDVRMYVNAETARNSRRWESRSKPLVADDPPRLLDIDVKVKIGEDLFFDEPIPRHESKQGYVSVTEKSLMWKKRGSTIFTVQGLTSNRSGERGWTITSSAWNHLSRRWTESEPALADFIHDEVTIQEKLESKGYSSPTWRLLRALQSIHGAVCVQGESAVTAPPFFKHAGRGATNFWGDSQGWQKEPTIFLWEALDEQGRQQCIEVMKQRTDWVVLARTSSPKREASGQRDFEKYGRVLVGQEVKGKATTEADDERTRDKNGGNSCRWKGWWKRGDVKAKPSTWPMSCWVHTRAGRDGHKQEIEDAMCSEAKKDECRVALKGLEHDFWMGTEAGMLGVYNFQGVVLGGDGSNDAGRMGAGFCCLQRGEIAGCIRVGREQEGTSSNRPELAALEAALRQVDEAEDILYLCDNESVLKEVNGWIGEGGKATLATAPNADIMREVLCSLRMRIAAGSATFLVKVKSHRGEPINEQADDLAEEGRQEEDDASTWTTRTGRMVFKKAGENGGKKSVWTRGVRNMIRSQASEAVLNGVWASAAERWVECVWWRLGQPWMQHPPGLAHVIRQQGLGDRVAWGKWCYEELEKEREQGGAKASWKGADTWCTNFLIRQGQSHQFVADWISNESVPMKRRRRIMQLELGNFPCGTWVHGKLDSQKSDRCSLCRKAMREEKGANFCEWEVPRETVGHISSAGCKGQKEVVTLAHNNVFRDLMFDIARHQKKTSVKDFTTLGTEKTLGSLWEREEYINMCSKEDLWEAVAEEEAKTPLEGEMQGAEHDEEEELKRRFWDKRPDGMVLDKKDKTCYVIEFKRAFERYGGAQEKTRQKAERQHDSLVRGLTAALNDSAWRVILVVFVGGMCGSVEEKAFNANMELMGVVESERNAIRKRHVWKLLEEQDRVLRSYYAQREGFEKGGKGMQGQTELGREHVGHGVYH